MKPLSRRDFLKVGGFAVLGTGAATALTQQAQGHQHHQEEPPTEVHATHAMQQGEHGDLPGTVGEVDHEKNGFNPTDLLIDFDIGQQQYLLI